MSPEEAFVQNNSSLDNKDEVQKKAENKFFISETTNGETKAADKSFFISENKKGEELFDSISADAQAAKQQADQAGAEVLADIKASYTKSEESINETNNIEDKAEEESSNGKFFISEEPAKKNWRDKFKQMFKI